MLVTVWANQDHISINEGISMHVSPVFAKSQEAVITPKFCNDDEVSAAPKSKFFGSPLYSNAQENLLSVRSKKS
jgi:hypothetical protein